MKLKLKQNGGVTNNDTDILTDNYLNQVNIEGWLNV